MSVAVYALHGDPSRRFLQDSINLAESLAASSGQAIPVLDSIQESRLFDELILAVEPSFDAVSRLSEQIFPMRDNKIRLAGAVLFVRSVDENDSMEPAEKEVRDLIFWGFAGQHVPLYRVDPEKLLRETKAGSEGVLPVALVTHVRGMVNEAEYQNRHETSLLVQAAGGPEGHRRLVQSAMNRFNQESGSMPRFDREVRVVTQALERVWSGEAAVAWLRSPNIYLEGARPMDVLSLHGPNQVVDALNEASAGRYA